MTLPATDREHFEALGYMRVRSAIGTERCVEMASALWRHLADQGIQEHDPATWRQPAGGSLSGLSKSGVLGITKGPVIDVIDDLLGSGTQLVSWGQPLVTFPTPGPDWSVPHQHWHTDFPAAAASELPGLLVLWALAPVPAGGGGTAILSGSHHLVDRLARSEPLVTFRSAELTKRILRSDAWFRALRRPGPPDDRRRRYMDEGATFDDRIVRVVELTAAAGEAVVVHPWTLHTITANRTAQPRLMARGIVQVVR